MLDKLIKTLKNPRLLRLSKLYFLGQARYAQAMRAYLRNEVAMAYPPVVVRIEPTNKCNLRCVMCPTGCDDKRESGFMDFSLYEQIIEEVSAFPYPTWVMLYLAGEPLLHKDLSRMIRLAKIKGLCCRFNTNASLLTPDVTENLLRGGLDCLAISFDDVSPQDYEAMRRGASYFKTLDNITTFLRKKKELGLLCPLVTIDSLRLRKPEDVVSGKSRLKPSAEFLKLFEGYDVQNIVSIWAHLWAGEFAEASPYVYKRQEGEYIGRCTLPWTDLTINWKGEVVACCYDLKSTYVIGNVNEQALLEIWNSERMLELRRKLLAGEYADMELCRSCSLVLGEVFL